MPTIDQIARAVGVSKATVSRALSGEWKAKYAPAAERFREIRRVANEMGYRPNAFAKGVGKGRFNALGLLMSSDFTERYMSEPLLQGITSTSAQRRQHLLLSIPPLHQVSSEAELPRLVAELACDGLLVNYTHNVPDNMEEAIQRHGIPTVHLNTKRQQDCVRPDDVQAGRESTEYLLELGHTDIAWLCTYAQGPNSHYSFADREQGYTKAMKDAGLQPRVMARPLQYMDAKSRRECVLTALTAHPRPTAFITIGEKDAIMLYTLAMQLGLSVPRDFSIINIYGVELDSLGVRLTTFLIDEAAVGCSAVEALLKKIESPGKRLDPLLLPGGIAQGHTCLSLK